MVALLAIALAIAVAVPRVVAAANADELIKEGVGLRRKGDDFGALQRFEQAYQIDKSPRALAQIGLAEQALGRWVAAHEHLTQALDSKTDAWIAKNRGAINDALAVVGEHVGRLEILGGSAKAEVRVDGISRGTLPLPAPLTVATGTVSIDLSAPGFYPVQRQTVVRARQTTRESFNDLVPVPTQATAQAAVAPAPVAPAVAAASSAVSEDRAPDAPASSEPATTDTVASQPSALRASAKWVAWALGAAAFGLGAYGYVQQTNAADEFDDDCFLDSDGIVQTGRIGIKREICQERQSRVDSGYRLELIGLISGGVLVGTGLVLWLTEPAPARAGALSWGCTPAMTPGSGWWLGCRLRF